MMRGMNMQGMMKQMQKLQKNMQKDQEELQKTVFEGHAPDDVDMLQDLVIAAVNDAIKKVEQETQRTMGKYSRNIPGL